jgi:hypothetical protein
MFIVRFGQSLIPCGRLNPQFWTWKKKKKRSQWKTPRILCPCAKQPADSSDNNTIFFKKIPRQLPQIPPPPTNPNFYFFKRTLVCKLGTLAWNLKFYKNNNNNNHLAYKLGEIACNLTKNTQIHTYLCKSHAVACFL